MTASINHVHRTSTHVHTTNQIVITTLHLYRGRSYQFDEFLAVWGDKLRSGGRVTAVTAGLQKDVDKYQVENI